MTGVDRSDEGAATIVSDIEQVETRILDTTASHFEVNATIYPATLFLMGIARRTLAQSRAIRQLIEDKNHLVAMAVIRMQLDTVLRLHALFLSADPNDLASRVQRGEQINRIKAADGSLMTDRYLKDRLLDSYPWIDPVYENTSGAIHFSDRHIWAALKVEDADNGRVTMQLRSNDPDHTLEDYHELLAVTRHLNSIIADGLDEGLRRLLPHRGR